MTGKIFPESANIYQDQAKILFNYYQQVAEKIVKEEERIEKEIKSLEERKVMIQSEIGTVTFWILTVVTLSIYYFWKTKDVAKKIAEDYNIPFVPLQKKIDEAVEKYGVYHVLYDGVHPNVFGAKLVANEWIKVFKEKVLC